MFFWKKTKQKKPKRTDYVFVADNFEKVQLAIYDKDINKFFDTIACKEIFPIYWAYVPLTPIGRWKKVGNILIIGKNK